jgi:hypothetical protein
MQAAGGLAKAPPVNPCYSSGSGSSACCGCSSTVSTILVHNAPLKGCAVQGHVGVEQQEAQERRGGLVPVGAVCAFVCVIMCVRMCVCACVFEMVSA